MATTGQRAAVAGTGGLLLPDATSSPSAVRSTIKDFSIEGVTFECWVIDGSFVWLSTDGRITVGRAGRLFWARIDGRHIGGNFQTLRIAMVSGARTLKTRHAA